MFGQTHVAAIRVPVQPRELTQEERRTITSLHRMGDGLYRVGASELFIRRDAEGDWGVYADTLDGPVRIRGAWAFKTLRDARRRAFAVAKEIGHA